QAPRARQETGPGGQEDRAGRRSGEVREAGPTQESGEEGVSTISVAVHPDADGVSRAVANRMAGAIVRTLADAEAAHICITGGRGGHGALAALAADEGIDWHRVHVWWSDERFVPAGDAQR